MDRELGHVTVREEWRADRERGRAAVGRHDEEFLLAILALAGTSGSLRRTGSARRSIGTL